MIVGTAGHIDHGKTALVRALTGTDTDRLAEEKVRGITIDLGFAYTDLGAGGVTGFVDVPGHERLVHTMLAGAGGIDLALIVVAADDGVMPQTREHLAILSLLGIPRALVVLSKADLAGEERRADVAAQITDTLADGPFAGAPVIPVSTITGEGLDTLRGALAETAATIAARASEGLLRMVVDRSFTLTGAGTVVTGMILSGTARPGDQVIVSPTGLAARIRTVHAQGGPAAEGRAGERCALNLAGEGIGKEAIRRGDMVLALGQHAPTDRIDAELHVLPGEPRAIGTWFPARLHVHAAEVGARIVPLGDPIRPGASGPVQIVTDRPIAAAVGDRFVLRDVSSSRTIGGGRLADLRAPARKRRTPDRLALVAAGLHTDPADALGAALAVGPVEATVFARDRALTPAVMAALTVSLPRLGGLVLSPAQRDGLRDGMAQALGVFHTDNPDLPGMGRERLRLVLTPRLPKDAFLALVAEEAREGCVIMEGAFLRLPSHEVRLSSEDASLADRILPMLSGDGRFRPPRVRDLATCFGVDEADVRRVLRMTQKLGRTDQIAHDHFFARATTAEMVGILCDVADATTDGWFTAPAFRDRVQNGRKVAIEILDFFDRHGVTLRRGDLRRINPHRLDLFGFSEGGPSGRETSLVGRPDFKSGGGSEPAVGGFDSRSLPPKPDAP